jgi:hypothetical protein
MRIRKEVLSGMDKTTGKAEGRKPSWGNRWLSSKEYQVDTQSQIRRHPPDESLPVVKMPYSGKQVE